MATPVVIPGSTKRLSFDFADVDGNAADPDSIRLVIRAPDGTEVEKTEADMVNPSTGTWTYDHPFTVEGRHLVLIDGDGLVDAADQRLEVYVRRKVTT